jgi:ABC-type amino acid transport substrate-binding protein
MLMLPPPANLTANLTVNQLAVQISSLADLAQTASYFGVPADSSISVYFTSSMDKSALLLRPRMVEYKNTDDAVADVRQGKIAAFVTDHINALYFTQVRGLKCSYERSLVGAWVCVAHACCITKCFVRWAGSRVGTR